jgi:hypothetical protein
LTGFIIGLLCKSDLVKEDIYRRGYMNLCISGAVVIIISSIGVSSIPNNVKYYVDQMKIFSIRENEALAAYNNLSRMVLRKISCTISMNEEFIIGKRT